MSAEVRVRLACAEDVPVLISLQRGTATAPQWDCPRYEQMLQSPQHVLLVAVDSDALAGFVAASVVIDDAEIESIVVDGARLRRGIGRALMEAFVAWATEHGVQRIFLEVRESNAAARGLYVSLKFEEVGRRAGYYSGPVEAAVVMRRTLR